MVISQDFYFWMNQHCPVSYDYSHCCSCWTWGCHCILWSSCRGKKSYQESSELLDVLLQSYKQHMGHPAKRDSVEEELLDNKYILMYSSLFSCKMILWWWYTSWNINHLQISLEIRSCLLIPPLPTWHISLQPDRLYHFSNFHVLHLTLDVTCIAVPHPS